MKKNIFLITEEEKRRILGLHEAATKRAYLLEETQSTVTTATTPGTTATTPGTTATTPGTTATTPATTATSKFGVDYKYNYPNDKSYVYGYKDGKWYAKSVANNNEFDLSTNPKWKSSIDNLNKQFASQIKAPAVSPIGTSSSPAPEVKLAATPLNQMQVQSNAPEVKLAATPLNQMQVQSKASNQQLATGQAVTAQTDPQVSADLKSASEIKKEFRQGKSDLKKLQKDRNKLYNVYNRLADKMDNLTQKNYLDSIAQFDELLRQQA